MSKDIKAGGTDQMPEVQENPYLVVFKKPFTFETETYESVDLSGLEEISA